MQKEANSFYDNYNSCEAFKIGQNLKRIRQNNGLSQEAFAELIGVSRQTVINWEKGNSLPSVDKVGIIIDKCSTSIEEILGRESLCSGESECEVTDCLAGAEEEICASVAERKKNTLMILLITGLSVVALFVLFVTVMLIVTIVSLTNSDAYAISYAFSLGDQDKLILWGIALVVVFVGIVTGVVKIIKNRGQKK